MTTLHTTSGRWQLGFALACATALCWITLPLGLKLALAKVDPYSLTWVRFAIALVCGALWLIWRGGLVSGIKQYRGPALWLLIPAALMLIGNYLFYILGLDYTTPGAAQVGIQLAPLLMALSGVLLFKEHYSWRQWLGFAGLLVGLGLFFSDQLSLLWQQRGRYLFGVLMIVLAAISWAIYAIAQKQLLRRMSSQQVMLFIYLGASIVLLPSADITALAALDSATWWVVIFCGVNTFIAYSTFAEALDHWQASRVSAVLALIPLGTLGATIWAQRWWPEQIAPEPLTLVGWGGATLVVLSSLIVSLSNQRKMSPTNINHQE